MEYSYLIQQMPDELMEEVKSMGPGATGTGMGTSLTGSTPGATSQGGGTAGYGGGNEYSSFLASLTDTGKRGITGGLIGGM